MTTGADNAAAWALTSAALDHHDTVAALEDALPGDWAMGLRAATASDLASSLAIRSLFLVRLETDTSGATARHLTEEPSWFERRAD